MLTIKGLHNPLTGAIHQQAIEERKRPLPELTLADFLAFKRTGDRAAYEQAYFARRRRLSVFGTAWLLDPTEDNSAALADILWSVCQEPTWALPAHFFKADGDGLKAPGAFASFLDLFAAETGQTVAYLLAAAQDHLPPELTAWVRYELQRRIFTPFLTQDWQWLYRHNNWAAVCSGSIGMAALSYYSDQSPELAKILAKVSVGMQNFLAGFGPDGASEEGIDYWAYGFGYYIYFAAQLARQTGDNHYLSAPKVKLIARFPYAASLFPGYYVKFGDTPTRTPDLPSGLLSYCTRHLGAPLPAPIHYSALDKNGRFAVLLHNLAWTDETLPTTPLAAETTLATVSWRLSRRKDWALASKAGNNGVSHNHNDIGSWELLTSTMPVVTELGSGEYTRDYFDDHKRYQLLEPRSLGHSVPLINGHEQIAGVGARGTLQTPVADETIIDYAAAYPAAARVVSLTRTFLTRTNMILITDTTEFTTAENSFSEVLILPTMPLRIPGQDNCWQLAADWRLQVSAGGQSVVEKLTTQDHLGQSYHVFRLRITYQFGKTGRVMLQLSLPQTSTQRHEEDNNA